MSARNNYLEADKVFVYGTLKSGQRMADALIGEHRFGDFQTPPIFSMRAGSFPMLFLNEKKGHSVLGELYTCSPETLARLDQYEGYPSFYTRKKLPVAGCVTGIQFDAWIYYIDDDEWAYSQYNKVFPDPDTHFLEWTAAR